MSRISTDRMRELLPLYFIMGSQNCKLNPEEVLIKAIEAGITQFQFREKGENSLKGRDKIEFAKKLQTICKKHKIPFIVNDDIELAIALDADGVHIGQDDESAEIVRQKIGDKILGVSTHSIEEVEKAILEGADYLGIGPVFHTKTKKDAKSVQGTELIERVRDKGIQIPIVGIGGITAHNAASVIKGGADGVSVVSAISMSDEPYESAGELRKAAF
ncbi:thiamine phosphate synthase [Metabacillus herbersteinensis]|uniref:Thiamine-phosphate synthase n=1 Tax=Metabacillus herbersteinensis TaxID=283816 RepID=A0ABV6GJJ1_9BACI